MEWLHWIEGLALATWVRESDSVLAYSGILFLHTLGLGVLVGSNVAVGLAVLSRRTALTPLSAFYPFAWLGFWINVTSGVLLVLADATTKLTNPVFYVKMACVAAAVMSMLRLRRHLRDDLQPARARFFAGLTLVLWATAITAGRLMAYLGPVSGAPELIN